MCDKCKQRQEHFMKHAALVASNSKCVSKHVGAIIVKDDRIISIGYNGTPPDMPNCNEVFDENNFNKQEHREWSIANEIHAEMNALMFAAKNGESVDGCDMYVTLHPCNNCLKNITMSGIKNVYYFEDHHMDYVNKELLKIVNVEKLENKELNKFIYSNNLIK